MTDLERTPGQWDVTIDGRGFLLDRASDGFAGPVSVPLLRPQQYGARTGEDALSTDGSWRRPITSWHHGAGQRYFDAPESDPYRFYESWGVDVWTPGEMRPVAAPRGFLWASSSTVPAGYGSGTNAPGATAGGGGWPLRMATSYTRGQIFAIIGQPTAAADKIIWSGIDSSFSSGYNFQRGLVPSGTDPFDLFCDGGDEVYWASVAGFGRNTSSTGNLVRTQTLTTGRIHSGHGRVVAADGTGKLWYITAWDGTALPAANFTHPNSPSAAFNCFATTQGAILTHALGEVWAITIKADGTGLNLPVPIAKLPPGEQAFEMCGYAGYVVVGTNRGVRVCTYSASNGLTIGPLLSTGTPPDGFGTISVSGIVGFDRWVYFTYSRFDDAGLSWHSVGRIDLGQTIGGNPLAFAYASDCYNTNFARGATPHTVGIVPQVNGGGRLCWMDLTGAWYADAPAAAGFPDGTRVSNAWMKTGRIAWGVGDLKVIDAVLTHQDSFTAPQSITVTAISDLDATTTVGAIPTGSAYSTLPAPAALTVTAADVVVTWANSGLTTTPPRVLSVTSTAYPDPPRVIRWKLPVILTERPRLRDGLVTERDAASDRDFLLAALTPRRIVSVRIGVVDYHGVVDDLDVRPQHATEELDGWEGTALVSLLLSVAPAS